MASNGKYTDPPRGGRYEWMLVSFFFLTWGFVFLDRLAISFLLPIIKPAMDLNNQQVGYISLVTTGCYAVSAIVFGAVSDRTGFRKRWLIPLVFGTAVFSGLGAVTHTFSALLIVRALVGVCEGPLWPLMNAMLARSSSRNAFGRNTGIVNCGVGLIAVTLGPIFITQLVARTTWQMTFLISALPTVVIALALQKWVKEARVTAEDGSTGKMSLAGAAKVLTYRNVWVCIFISMGSMAGYWTLALYAPLYLTDTAKLNVTTMGWVTSGMGVLYIVYSFLVPKLSDNWGRKPVLIGFYVLCTIAPLIMFLSQGSTFSVIIYVLFGGVLGAMSPLFMILIPMESLPDNLRATANGVIMGFGEVIGGSLFPVIAGWIADSHGYPFMMLVTAIIVACDVILGFFLMETNSRKKRLAAERTAKETGQEPLAEPMLAMEAE